MSPLESGILGLYFLTLVILAVLGFHRYVMVYLYFKNRDERAVPLPLPETLPRVTVQLPIFNELYVVERLLESVCGMRYPKNLLEIQVLDDSTDETVTLARGLVERYQAEGYDIHYLHRTDRTGFKAGALDARAPDRDRRVRRDLRRRLHRPRGLPGKDARPLRRIPRSGSSRPAGGTSTADYSLLTQVQSIMLDGHFVLEHARPQPLGPLLQLQRHRRRSGGAPPSTTRAAGSTTRSPRTSTCRTAPSSGAGASSTSRTW